MAKCEKKGRGKGGFVRTAIAAAGLAGVGIIARVLIAEDVSGAVLLRASVP